MHVQVTPDSVIDFIPTLSASGPRPPMILENKNLLDPHKNFDFSRMTDDGTEYERGGYRYYRPYGWKRIALKVKGEYNSDTWLGEGTAIILYM